MHTTRFTAGCLVLFSVLLLATTTAEAQENSKPGHPTEPELIQLLRSDAPAAAKAPACKLLAVYGSEGAVPELAKLLTDEQLASWARIALEAIPGSAADEALRGAIPALKGKLLIGVINSIGVRRDAGAVEVLTARVQDPDAETASAAVVALGHIGNSAALKALRASLAAAPAPIKTAVAEGCVLCAERLLAAGNHDEAVAVYDEVRKAEVPKQNVLEATRGAILARRAGGIPLLIEQLKSPDKSFFQIGLSTARELPGAEVSPALSAELVGAAPERAALLLNVLADRGDKTVLPAVLQTALSGSKEVRIAALAVLPRLGDGTLVEPLLAIAAGQDAELAAAAKSAVAALPGEKIDADLKSRLASAQDAASPLLIEIVGLRRVEATPELVKLTGHSDVAVRRAALSALGATIGLKDLSVLISEATAPKHAEDAQAAQQALLAACVRMPEGDACAEQLALAMASAPAPTNGTLLEIVGAMGGAKSLEIMSAAGKGNDPQLQEIVVRVLGKSLNLEAAPVLLDLAKTAPSANHQVNALRGYIRFARQFIKADAQRVAMCEQAWAVAQRTEEKKLVLEVLGRTQSIAALRMAVAATETPELRDDGTRVALALAKKIGDKPEVRELIAKIRPSEAK
ncbi:MAG: HEAT repeat domain-containing protein [Planctomycetia bacterium]|nr:HEAT repeat domain-containing protein [Planctomycetia bacterium]